MPGCRRSFCTLQWTRLPGGETPPAFATRVRQLLGLDRTHVPLRRQPRRAWLWQAPEVPILYGDAMSPLTRLDSPLLLFCCTGRRGFWYFEDVNDAPTAKPELATARPAVAVAPDDKSIAVCHLRTCPPKESGVHGRRYRGGTLEPAGTGSDLKVIARTSSFAFKGQNLEIAEIAKKLNVAHVLEGSVRTSGNQMRITAQLVRAADSTHLWSENYDRPMDDIFAVQDEIANAIVQALQIRFKGWER